MILSLIFKSCLIIRQANDWTLNIKFAIPPSTLVQFCQKSCKSSGCKPLLGGIEGSVLLLVEGDSSNNCVEIMQSFNYNSQLSFCGTV